MNGAPCQHLEKLLPRDNGPFRAGPGFYNSQLVASPTMSQKDYEKKAKKLELALQKLGLEAFRAELLMLRFVDKMTLRDIAKHCGYLDHKVVFNLINDTLQTLKRADSSLIRKALKDYQ